MKSLDTLLAEAVGKMKPSTRKKFHEKTTGENISQESLINIAESMVAEDGELAVRESRPIRRNNGASDPAYETVESIMAEGDRILMEGIAKRDPAFAKAAQVSEAGVSSLTPKQRADYEFCRLLHMSESDALKVATSNAIRD